jgi:metal-sulfur cluster biosynthetic enzyme
MESMSERNDFPYTGDERLREPIEKALAGVVDPELSLAITDVGLVYGVDAADDRVAVTITMTSAACPVADIIIEDIERELDAVLPAGRRVDVDLVWDPPWTPERMSERARRFLEG